MNAQARENLLDRCVDFHGHLCMGQVLGVRLALKGMECIGTRNYREMIVLIENDRCIADAIQIVTGTRIGRRSAKLINYGKMAATFINTETGASYRVSIRHVNPKAGYDKEQIRRVLHVPDSELLSIKRVRVPLRPEDFPGRPLRTVNCINCEEKVFDGKDVPGDNGPLCPSCSHGSYYEVLEEDE